MNTTDLTTPTIRPARLLHTMLRVADLERSLRFYTGLLGMSLLRLEHYPNDRFTLAFVGYRPEATDACIELTHNWDTYAYQHGTAYGHIALAVDDVIKCCAQLQAAGVAVVRPAGPMRSWSPESSTTECIAFIEDPDGYRVELIEQAATSLCNGWQTTIRDGN